MCLSVNVLQLKILLIFANMYLLFNSVTITVFTLKFNIQNSKLSYPTDPSKLISINLCASTANSIGSSANTSLQNPLTIIDTASSVDIPR